METLGFTIKAQMPNAKVLGPPNAGAFKERKSGMYIIVDTFWYLFFSLLRSDGISQVLWAGWFPNCIRARHKRKPNSMESWNRKAWLSPLSTTLLRWTLVSSRYYFCSFAKHLPHYHVMFYCWQKIWCQLLSVCLSVSTAQFRYCRNNSRFQTDIKLFVSN